MSGCYQFSRGFSITLQDRPKNGEGFVVTVAKTKANGYKQIIGYERAIVGYGPESNSYFFDIMMPQVIAIYRNNDFDQSLQFTVNFEFKSDSGKTVTAECGFSLKDTTQVFGSDIEQSVTLSGDVGIFVSASLLGIDGTNQNIISFKPGQIGQALLGVIRFNFNDLDQSLISMTLRWPSFDVVATGN